MKKRILFMFITILMMSASVTNSQTTDSVWIRRYNGSGNGVDQANAIAIDRSGNIVVTGQSTGYGSGGDFVTFKYGPAGDSMWVNAYNGTGNSADCAYAIAIDTFNILGGDIFVAGVSTGATDPDYALVKYRSNGVQAWVKRYSGSGMPDAAYDVAAGSGGFVYVTGASSGVTSFDYATIKYDSLGSLIWTKRYNGPGSGSDAGHAIEVDVSDNVYVTGASQGSGTDYDFATIKYRANGDTAWVRRFNGPASGPDTAKSIVLDVDGNIYVTGTSFGSGTNFDFMTVKYDSLGVKVWEKGYNGTGNNTDDVAAMAIDPSGNVIVTGRSWGLSSKYDIATAKYLPNGDTAWVRRYDGPSSGDDVPHAIAVDRNGNVYIAGSTFVAGDSTNYVAIRYNSNGSIGWIRRYKGPSYGVSEAFAIAVDNAENVFVTGRSLDDYATIRYSYIGPLVVTAYSPVNIKVTDPADNYIGKDSHGILSQTLFPADYYDDMPPDMIDSVVIPYPIEGNYTITIVAEEGATPGATYTVGVRIDGTEQCMLIVNALVPNSGATASYTYSVEEGWHYKNGDANDNGIINIQDITFLISYLYKGGPPPMPIGAGDSNCSGIVNIQDITYLINFLYKSGPMPCQII